MAQRSPRNGSPAAARRRSPWKPLAAAAVGVSVLAIAGQGVFAGRTASVTIITPQAVAPAGWPRPVRSV